MADPVSLGVAAVGSLASGFMGMQAANHAQYQQYKYNKLLQEAQAALNYGYYKKQLKFGNTHMYSYQRKGLESAGYNPMLAVQGVNADTAGTSFASGNSVGMPDAVGALNSGIERMRMLQDVKASDANIDNVNADTVMKNAQTENINNDSILKQAQENLTRSQTVINDIEADWKDKREAKNLEKTSQEIIKMGAEMDYMKEQVKLQQTKNEIDQFNAVTNRIDSRTNATRVKNDYDIKKNTKTYSDSIHLPFGIGGSSSVSGYNVEPSIPVFKIKFSK